MNQMSCWYLIAPMHLSFASQIRTNFETASSATHKKLKKAETNRKYSFLQFFNFRSDNFKLLLYQLAELFPTMMSSTTMLPTPAKARITRELSLFSTSPPPGISCYTPNDTLTHLHANIDGK